MDCLPCMNEGWVAALALVAIVLIPVLLQSFQREKKLEKTKREDTVTIRRLLAQMAAAGLEPDLS